MINVKTLHANKIKIDIKSCKYSHLLHWICDNQKPKIRKINNVNPLYLIIYKINGYIKESNGNKYLMLFPTDESKGTLEKYEKL